MFEKLNRLALQLNWLVKVSTNNKEMIIEPYLQATIHVAHFRLSSWKDGVHFQLQQELT